MEYKDENSIYSGTDYLQQCSKSKQQDDRTFA